MRRLQLVEIEDLAWCPRAVRDGATDWLSFMANVSKVFSATAPKIRAVMDRMHTGDVVDLCSGGGGPWLTLQRALAESGPVNVVLSDRYPNVQTLGGVCARSSGRLRLHVDAVDATEVPSELAGVRTMFNSLHHFTPEIATQILVDAVRQRRGVAFFEGVNHRGVGLLAVYLQLPAILLLTPFVRPFRWSRLLLTYVCPLIPLLILFDGTVSILRLYLEDELRELVAAVPGGEEFEWDIGAIGVGGSSIGLAYLIGAPRPGRHIGAAR